MTAAQPSKLDLWWRLCADQIAQLEVWQKVYHDERKPFPPEMANRLKLYQGLAGFLERIERNRAEHEAIMGRVK